MLVCLEAINQVLFPPGKDKRNKPRVV